MAVQAASLCPAINPHSRRTQGLSCGGHALGLGASRGSEAPARTTQSGLNNWVGILLLAVALCSTVAFPVSVEIQAGDPVVAAVNRQNITAAQLEAMTKAQVEPLNREIQQIRESALQKLIDNLLLEQAAKAEGTTVDEYVRKHVKPVLVPDAEVEEVYESNKDQFAGLLGPEAKYRIRRRMEDKRHADSIRQLLESLRRNGKVRNFLAEATAASLNLRADRGPSRGKPDAPVTLVAFIDFECAYCRRDQPTLKGILEKWPNEVRLVFRHFPLGLHPHAFQAAVAAVCADKQGRFWEFEETALRENQDLNTEGVSRMASSLGLDMEAFRLCLASRAATEKVREDIDTGQAAGVDGTPAYFVNNRRVHTASELERTVAETLSQRQ
ncbi:MAG: thioredoxin domain-containing protein [Terriglobia bacterium]